MLAPSPHDGRPYGAKIAECYALRDASDDPLMRAVYLAMASEFEARAGPRVARAAEVPGGRLPEAPPALPRPRLVPQAR
jgi:hypothetical protein